MLVDKWRQVVILTNKIYRSSRAKFKISIKFFPMDKKIDSLEIELLKRSLGKIFEEKKIY